MHFSVGSVGPEHNNMFVIYSLDVTLAGNR